VIIIIWYLRNVYSKKIIKIKSRKCGPEINKSAHVDEFTRHNLPDAALWPDLGVSESWLQYPERLNAAVALLDETIKIINGDKIAIIDAYGQYSYDSFLLMVKRYAQFLELQGVRPGNRVLLRGPNNAATVALWFATIRVGAVAVTTIPLQRAIELEKIITISKAQFAFIDHRFTTDWDAVTNFAGQSFIYGGPPESDSLAIAQTFSGEHQACDTASDDVALLAFTSGSTGIPKATMHFHRDLLAIADTFAHHIVGSKSSDIFTGTPPIAFTFGLGGLVIFPFRVGATTALFESITPPQLLEKIAELKITCLFTAPTAYRAMLATATPENTKSLRRCISAGEHLPKATWEAWHQATGIKIIDGIGATELLHIFISAADEKIIPGMTGMVVPGYQAKIVDENFLELPDGEIGRLAVKGPTGCRYLYGDRQEIYVKQGWNLTGDLYIKHPNGHFQYQSRSDDMIISSGYNIAAPEVENAILTHASVLETAVIGLPDSDRGMLVAAYIVLKAEFADSDQLKKEIQDHVKATIAPFKYPRVINFVATLPKTTTGKLQRFRLKDNE
jgi:2-aminobenzoate-CoA ligase